MMFYGIKNVAMAEAGAAPSSGHDAGAPPRAAVAMPIKTTPSGALLLAAILGLALTIPYLAQRAGDACADRYASQLAPAQQLAGPYQWRGSWPERAAGMAAARPVSRAFGAAVTHPPDSAPRSYF
jgi:hypothetical protein